MEISVALYERILGYFEHRLEELEVSQTQTEIESVTEAKPEISSQTNTEISTEIEANSKAEIDNIVQQLRLIAAHSQDSSQDSNELQRPDLAQAVPFQAISKTLAKERVDFSVRLFEAWRLLASDEIGENFWSYQIKITEIADEMAMPIHQFIQNLELLDQANLQVIKNRGINQADQLLTFHPIAEPAKTSKSTSKSGSKSGSKSSSKLNPNSSEKQSAINSTQNVVINEQSTKFVVGDRIRINEQRPQYALHTGTVTQVISVSCRVALDNGWSAFLPHHCLEKI
jgi:hypothetical protein